MLTILLTMPTRCAVAGGVGEGGEEEGMIQLIQIPRTHPIILSNMMNHYSAPKGFVGRNICYAVLYEGVVYGSIAGGSATRFLPGRNEFLGISKSTLNTVINNIFFHVEKQKGQYPCREFCPKVLAAFRKRAAHDWTLKYGDKVVGFESLVEIPRTGECYKRDGWTLVGQTVGYTCKRTCGRGTDSWSGKRVWDTNNLRPKLVFAKLHKLESPPILTNPSAFCSHSA